MERPPSIDEDEVLAVAAALPAPDRSAYLIAVCGGDGGARLRLEKRLGEEPTPLPVQEPVVETEIERLKPEQSGDRLGHYKLLEQIGEGGFGVVWIAEQDAPVKRRVALKLLKCGMDTRQIIARFEQERQALALMDHPNIAKVFDAGATPLGRPYFVMELVRGVKITDYCDQARVTTAERLRLFIAVARGVQHAHQKGIIHRDIKPSNILVALHDGKPVPKIIDFGVAKALQQHQLTDLTIYTQVEQMIGTPAYMSPEQAEMSGLDIDTRSDIYSLGVLLYELLAGLTPFDPKLLNMAGPDGIRRVLREQEPNWPSAALCTLDALERIRIARNRQEDFMNLVRIVRGDLDCIVMKALEKERSRRYDTANDLIADIERFLDQKPIRARPPGRVYRFRRFVSRHKTAVGSAAAVVAALVVGLSVSMWQAVRANREADRANEALRDLRSMAPALASQARELVTSGDPEAAIQRLGYAIRLRPDSAEYLRDRAALFLGKLQFSEAAADLRRLQALQPGDRLLKGTLSLCDRLDAERRSLTGKPSQAVLAALYEALAAEHRSAAELMPLARAIGREKELLRSYWADRLSSLPNASNTPIAERLKTGPHQLLELDLRGTDVADLSGLEDAPLGFLNLSGCTGVRSVEALRRMPLRKLDLSETSVTSLEPLATLPQLEELALTGVPIANLEPLQGLPLRKLGLAKTEVSSLAPIRHLKLTHLEVGHTQVADLSPLTSMPLVMLECSFTPVADYSPLSKSSVEHLALQGTKVGDLSFLRGTPLKSLVLTDARDVANFRVLSEIKTLELLILPGNLLELPKDEIEGIESLRNHPSLQRISSTLKAGSSADSTEGAPAFWRMWDSTMRWWRPLQAAGIRTMAKRLPDDTWMVSVQGEPVRDLGIFAGSRVSTLDLTGCREVSDLAPLRDLPLATLSIAHTSVSDLTPVAKLPLRSLWMADTRVTDLSPLRTLPLKSLYMDKCPLLTEVGPIAEIRDLEEVLLPEGAQDVAKLRKLPKLRRISYTFDLRRGGPVCPATDFWKEFSDLSWLRKLRERGTQVTATQLEDATWKVAIHDTAFTSADLLATARISDLSLEGTRVTDLGPLARLPLKRLRLDGTPATDVGPLASVPSLESIVLPSKASNISRLKTLTHLKRVAFDADARGEPALDAAAFWKSVEAKDR